MSRVDNSPGYLLLMSRLKFLRAAKWGERHLSLEMTCDDANVSEIVTEVVSNILSKAEDAEFRKQLLETADDSEIRVQAISVIELVAERKLLSTDEFNEVKWIFSKHLSRSSKICSSFLFRILSVIVQDEQDQRGISFVRGCLAIGGEAGIQALNVLATRCVENEHAFRFCEDILGMSMYADSRLSAVAAEYFLRAMSENRWIPSHLMEDFLSTVASDTRLSSRFIELCCKNETLRKFLGEFSNLSSAPIQALLQKIMVSDPVIIEPSPGASAKIERSSQINHSQAQVVRSKSELTIAIRQGLIGGTVSKTIYRALSIFGLGRYFPISCICESDNASSPIKTAQSLLDVATEINNTPGDVHIKDFVYLAARSDVPMFAAAAWQCATAFIASDKAFQDLLLSQIYYFDALEACHQTTACLGVDNSTTHDLAVLSAIRMALAKALKDDSFRDRFCRDVEGMPLGGLLVVLPEFAKVVAGGANLVDILKRLIVKVDSEYTHEYYPVLKLTYEILAAHASVNEQVRALLAELFAECAGPRPFIGAFSRVADFDERARSVFHEVIRGKDCRYWFWEEVFSSRAMSPSGLRKALGLLEPS